LVLGTSGFLVRSCNEQLATYDIGLLKYRPLERFSVVQARVGHGKSLRDSWQGEWCGCSVWHRTTPWTENLRRGFHARLNTNISNTHMYRKNTSKVIIVT